MVAATQRGQDPEAAAAAVEPAVACATGLDPLEMADLRRRLRTVSARLTS